MRSDPRTQNRMSPGRWRPAVLMGAILMAGLGAGAVLLAETRNVVQAGHSLDMRLEALADGRPVLALSERSMNRVLDLCRSVLDDPRIWSRDYAMIARAEAHCHAQARLATTRAPAWAPGWTALALFEMRAGDIDRGAQALDRARALAPDELWLALQRAPLWHTLELLERPGYRAGQDADFLLMARSPRGVRALAARWLEDPAFRARIVALVETLPPEPQRRFRNEVWAAVERAG